MVEKNKGLTVLSHLVLLLGVLIVAFPLYIAFVASTHTAEAIVQAPMPLLPGSHFADNYSAALFGHAGGAGSKAPVAQMMWVSLVTALVIALGKIAISLLSAFAIVYFRFPFKSFFFWAIFVTLMLPVEVRILPTYQVISDLGLLNSYAGLTVPLIASATATFLFRQFFMTVPDELVEAARMDGAGPMRFFQGCAAAAVQHQHCRLVRHPVHLRLEPIPLALAGDHRREHVPGGDRHQAHDQRRRCRQRLEHHHGHRPAGNDPTSAGGDLDAALVRQGLVDTEK